MIGLERPYPWEKKVTVCIAAIYDTYDESRYQQGIILCTDWLSSSPLGQSETSLKERVLKPGWYCLTAGTKSEILATLSHLKREFRSAEEINETNVVNIVRTALNARKREKSEEYTQGKYGLSYADFLSFGKEKLPPELFRESFIEIGRINLECELIIAGFTDGFPCLVESDRKCRVHVREAFAVIGEGGILASAALLQREQTDSSRFGYTLYSVYEAKKYVEHVTTVGKFTSITVFSPDGTKRLSRAAKDELEEKYKKYGPRDVPYKISIEANLYAD